MDQDLLTRHGISQANVNKIIEYVKNNDKNGLAEFLEEEFKGIAMIDNETIIEYCFGEKCNYAMLSLVLKWEITNKQNEECRGKLRTNKIIILCLVAVNLITIILIILNY